MTIVLDDDIAGGAGSRAGGALAAPSRLLTHADLPDLHEAPKRRLHPMIVGALGFAVATGAFYGAEAIAPLDFKPSAIIGGYRHEIAAAQKAGELRAQIRYDAAFRDVDLQYQDQVKAIETAAIQWQEAYKTKLSGITESYRGAWSRANIFAQATADLQKQYVAARQQIAIQSSGGDVAISSLADMVAGIADLVDPGFASSARGYGDRARSRIYGRLDQAAQGGTTIAVEGWNSGLPDPDAVAARVADLPPLVLPPFKARPVLAAPATPSSSPAR